MIHSVATLISINLNPLKPDIQLAKRNDTSDMFFPVQSIYGRPMRFQIFLESSPRPGEMIQFDWYVQMG